MAKSKKYYAVRKGRKIGIFTTWNECKKQVHGFSSAVYKSFKTKEEAERYLRANSSKKKNVEKFKRNDREIKISEKSIDTKGILEGATSFNEEYACAYVDGSYFDGIYSGAALVIHKGIETHIAKAYEDDQSSLRNVAGEIMGVMLAIEFCQSKSINNLCVYHDYQGLSEWADDKWKAKLPLTKEYKEFISDARDGGMSIVFQKVKAHSGVQYNEIADRLAKDAIKNIAS